MMLRRRHERRRIIARVMTTALAVAVALVFTPCCELFAASSDAGAVHADAGAARTADPHAPAPDHWCGTARDEIASPIGDLAPPATNSSTTARHVALGCPLSFACAPAPHRPATGLGLVGPPLYLRFAHLLI